MLLRGVVSSVMSSVVLSRRKQARVDAVAKIVVYILL